VTATIKAGAEVNAAIGGAVSRGGNSAPPRAGGTAAAAAAVTQSRAAQTSTITTIFRTPPTAFVPPPPPEWRWSSTKFLEVFFPTSLAGSYNGDRILARRDGINHLYATINGGVSWINNASIGSIGSIVKVSYDGTLVVYATRGAGVWFSSNGGVNFSDITPPVIVNGIWTGLAMSSDGTKIAVSEETAGYIYTATRSGSTWTWTRQTSSGAKSWLWIVGSADGSILIAGAAGDSYRSTNGGVTWSAARSMGVAASVVEVYCSEDATILFGRQNGTTTLFKSVDGGATWSATGPVKNWRGNSMSANGVKMIATLNGEVWLSETSGSIWTQQPDISGGDMRSIYISGDGNRIAVASYGSSKVYFAANV